MSKWIVDIHGDIEGDYELIKKYEEPCEMTAEEYRQRMIQAFHNADRDEFIAICVLPTEKEFEHLEWLLKNHYEKETITEFADRCRDCKYFEYDSVAKVDGVPLIVAHEICTKWGDGCETSEDGYCFLFEPKEK